MIEPPSDEELERDAQGARRAASLILLRDGAQGPEVLMLRRAERPGDLRGGVWVFPGGVLDAVDATLADRTDGPDDASWSRRFQMAGGALDHAVAALRETYEEVGLLLAGPPERVPLALARRAQVRRGEDFAQLLSSLDLTLHTSALLPFAHWLTPPGIAKRFDTRFFIARAPSDQLPQVDAAEALALDWLRPADALAPSAGLKLLPVTRETLRDLARHASVQEALDEAAARQQFVRQMPRQARYEGGARFVLPHEPAWAEIGRLDPLGRGDQFLDLVPLRRVRLSPRVERLTCGNGSVMTGPGTNTYLIRDPAGEQVAVLDPGPLDAHTEAHLQAVLAAAAQPAVPGGAAGRITHILVTHTHRDHSPAARRLQALTGAALVGAVAQDPTWQDTDFRPDWTPADGQALTLGPDCTLQAVATPGHASNHLCWWLPQEGLLFTGDHVMQGSTVVINPPDGDMAAYCRSLRRLLDLPLRWLAPGHGFLMASPPVEVGRLLAHRQVREARVLAALPRGEGATPQALVAAVYGDVPASRHGLAARSLLAHLLKLEAEGRARRDGEAWRAA
ncbi:MBL fold metallo-hydrolase [Ideonella sp. TBM-1]|uniref:MBL fold metallo-hydrolase n=2 Tax=Ideonella livida TaxID=2707176 RepID=A0A7C9TNM8_9BURK|nr:MBL fold metallo-hydrolase [Ideonella livida]